MAKKFNFRYESILKIRSEKVTQAQESLNQVVKVRIDKEKVISEFKDYKDNLIVNNGISAKASDFQNRYYHKQFIDSEITKLENEKKQIIEIENLRRSNLSSAMKDEKIMEKLKDKNVLSHKEDVKREESKFLDEVGISVLGKNRDKM